MLDGEDRKILLAREYEDRSFVEIGAELGMSANAVRMRWVRALERLAKVMQTMRNGDVPDEPAG
jgi:DNA-directed RNA polymerase specialized sigma24 family protein